MGFITKQDGPLKGSLYVYGCNNRILAQPFIVYGTPSFHLPYSDPDHKSFKSFIESQSPVLAQATSYFLQTKHNGEPITFYKYQLYYKDQLPTHRHHKLVSDDEADNNDQNSSTFVTAKNSNLSDS